MQTIKKQRVTDARKLLHAIIFGALLSASVRRWCFHLKCDHRRLSSDGANRPKKLEDWNLTNNQTTGVQARYTTIHYSERSFIHLHLAVGLIVVKPLSAASCRTNVHHLGIIYGAPAAIDNGVRDIAVRRLPWVRGHLPINHRWCHDSACSLANTCQQ